MSIQTHADAKYNFFIFRFCYCNFLWLLILIRINHHCKGKSMIEVIERKDFICRTLSNLIGSLWQPLQNHDAHHLMCIPKLKKSIRAAAMNMGEGKCLA